MLGDVGEHVVHQLRVDARGAETLGLRTPGALDVAERVGIADEEIDELPQRRGVGDLEIVDARLQSMARAERL